jgi:ChpA-C
MHGYAKRGLVLVAAASGLVLGSAAVAAADATVSAEASMSSGAGSGNVASAPVDVPVNACGNQAVAAAVRSVDDSQMCNIGDGGGASVTTSTQDDRGAVSGNDINGAADVPVNACGNQVEAIAISTEDKPSTCTIDGSGNPEASVNASTEKSGGLISGNVVSGAVAVPVNACGDQVVGIGAYDKLDGATCSIN